MISLIIPFYNCKQTAENTMSILMDYLKEHPDIEVIAVNDGSTDDTHNTLLKYHSERVSVVSYTDNMGKGYAIKKGVFAAKGDKIIFTDADLAYGLEPIEAIASSLSDCHLVVGTRRNDKDISKNYGFLRSFSSNAFSYITQHMLNLDIDDTQCGFKGYKSSVAKSLFENLSINGFGFDLEILALARKQGYSICQVPVTLLTNEKQSTVKLLRDGLKMIGDILYIRRKLRRD